MQEEVPLIKTLPDNVNLSDDKYKLVGKWWKQKVSTQDLLNYPGNH